MVMTHLQLIIKCCRYRIIINLIPGEPSPVLALTCYRPLCILISDAMEKNNNSNIIVLHVIIALRSLNPGSPESQTEDS